MGIFVKFWLFHDARSPNMAMSRDPRCTFGKLLFCPNSTFNIRKSHKISSGKALYFRSYQPKTSPGGGGGLGVNKQLDKSGSLGYLLQGNADLFQGLL